jgi:cytochrome P450
MAGTNLQSVLEAAKSTSLTILALLPTLLAIYILTTAFYNLYLHPLSSHPGPLLARITKLHDVYHAYRGDKHIHLYHLHARYGPVVRFSPNSLSINDPAALKAIYGHGANVQKSETFYHAFRAHPAAVSTLLATERVQHARKRRIMGQAFSETAMRGMERYVLENVEVWLKGVEERVEAAIVDGRKWSERVDMGKWNNYLVFGEC